MNSLSNSNASLLVSSISHSAVRAGKQDSPVTKDVKLTLASQASALWLSAASTQDCRICSCLGEPWKIC